MKHESDSLLRRRAVGAQKPLKRDAGNGLQRGNGSLRQDVRELAAANRQLKSEIARRVALEEALKKSEQHYSKLLGESNLMQEQLRHLSRQILLTQEEERRQISRQLHDEIAQTLTGINVHLAALKNEAKYNASDLRKKIAMTQRLVQKSMVTVHRFARDLRPTLLDDLGLIPALTSFMKDFTKRTRIPIRFRAFAGVVQLDSMKRTVLYRVALEALTNVAKHARASLVHVSVQKIKNDIHMEIKDNGKAFKVERVLSARKNTRLGLLGMRERIEMVGGSFAVESIPGQGTTIFARIPFNGEQQE